MSLSTSQLRKAWARYECRADDMVEISFGPDRIRVAPPTVEAWQALAAVLLAHGYEIRTADTDSYNCRTITGGKGKSLHSYGIALDVNWTTNPFKTTKPKRKPVFSDKPTQAARAEDVKRAKADTDMTPQMIADALAIRTRDGKQVFEWGGNWNTVKDAMHFEIDLAPEDLAGGIDWATVRAGGQILAPPVPGQAPGQTPGQAPGQTPGEDQPGTIDANLPPVGEPELAGIDETALFQRAHGFIAQYEGGYVDHPADPGGATNFGITRATLARWRGRPVSKADVKALSFDEAREIFRKWYWAPLHCGRMPGPLALAVYNVSVHAGPKTAAKYLQTALNRGGAALEIDGVVGELTRNAVATCDPAEATGLVIDQYEAKLRAHPRFNVFGRGFLRRVASLRAATDEWLAELSGEPPIGPPTMPPVTPPIDQEPGVPTMPIPLPPTRPTISDPALTVIDKVLGGRLFAGKKTILAAAAYAAFLLGENSGVINVTPETKQVIVQYIGLFGGLGVVSKVERWMKVIAGLDLRSVRLQEFEDSR